MRDRQLAVASAPASNEKVAKWLPKTSPASPSESLSGGPVEQSAGKLRVGPFAVADNQSAAPSPTASATFLGRGWTASVSLASLSPSTARGIRPFRHIVTEGSVNLWGWSRCGWPQLSLPEFRVGQPSQSGRRTWLDPRALFVGPSIAPRPPSSMRMGPFEVQCPGAAQPRVMVPIVDCDVKVECSSRGC